MLAFHNEHIASCAFLTYFSPESTTAAAATAAATASTTVPSATLLNDKQAITGITCICCSPVGSRCRHQPYLQRQQTHQHSKTFIKACFCTRRAMQKSLQQQQQEQQQKRQYLHLMQLHQLQVSLMNQQQQQIQQKQQRQVLSQQQQQQQQYDMFLASSCGLDKIVTTQC